MIKVEMQTKYEFAFLLAAIECSLAKGSYNEYVNDEEVNKYLNSKKLLMYPTSYLVKKLQLHEKKSRELGQNNS